MKDALALTGNIAFLSVFYVFVGSLLSFALYYIFDDYDPKDEQEQKWAKKSTLYQFGDVALEVMRLNGATRSSVFRVEVQHHPLALEVMQTEACAVLRRQGEIRSSG